LKIFLHAREKEKEREREMWIALRKGVFFAFHALWWPLMKMKAFYMSPNQAQPEQGPSHNAVFRFGNHESNFLGFSLSLSLSEERERERGFSARFSILVFVYRKLVGSKPKAKYIHVEIELDSCWRPYLLVWTHENVELWERERERERVKSFGHAESAETFVVQNILWEEYTLE